MILKRAKLLLPHDDHHHHHPEEDNQLIPGLPDHIAHLILSKIHPQILYSVSQSWRQFIYSPVSPPFLSLYSLISSPNSTLIHLSCFDPISALWVPFPPPPVHLLSSHPSFLSRDLPIQATTVRGRLVVVAATSRHLLPALPRPLVFDPLSSSWGFGPPLLVPRRWCATGALGGAVYVAGGVGSQFNTNTAQSVERWDLRETGTENDNTLKFKSGFGRWNVSNHLNEDVSGTENNNCWKLPCIIGSYGGCWNSITPLPNRRFSREAVGAVGWRGRLCMVNVAAKEGAVYDAGKDTWGDIAEGMVAGWRGPVASLEEEDIYVVDEWKGVLRRYEEERDCWVDVMEDERLRGAQQMAAGGGRVCVVCGGGGGRIVVVDVVASPARMWVVEPPAGFKTVAVHVLPRMSRPDFHPPVIPSTPWKL